MDAVILAAGRNERLKGLVAPYHKPLLVINGKPLILSVFEACANYCGRVIVVTAPENTKPICDILNQNLWFKDQGHVIVQPDARGPGEAMLRGMRLSQTEQTNIVCADNVIPKSDMELVVKSAEAVENDIVLGGRVITDPLEALRFTRLDVKRNRLIEGSKGGEFDGGYHCWLGPLVLPTLPTINHFETIVKDSSVETKISQHLNGLNRKFRFLPVNCLDIGVPEALS